MKRAALCLLLLPFALFMATKIRSQNRAAAGKSVTTVEGIGASSLHPVQKAFMVHDALQCGFCTPGFIVEAAAFHDRWRATKGTATPSREEIGAALSGHLCRCGAYDGIFSAVAAACAGQFDGGESVELPSSFPWKEPIEELGDRTIAPEPTWETLRFDQVAVGDELPKLVIELTPTLIIATAIATQDYQDVHHDRDMVQRRGHPDVFMNILTTTGFAGRFITDWAGPEALIQAAGIRLGVPNYPYGEMTISGRVTEREEQPTGDRGTLTVEVRGVNKLGTHLDGQLTLTLPR